MSITILHNVIHGRTLQGIEVVHPDEKRTQDFDKLAKESIDKFNEYLSKGYQILDKFDTQHHALAIRCYVLHLPENTLVSVQNIDVVYITSIENKSTFSKTHQVDFDYFRCGFGHNKFVNIFDHPDDTRNTWRIAENRGWTWVNLQDAVMNSYPVPVTLSYDGEWFALVDIMSKTEYDFMCEVIDTMNGAKDDDSE